MANAMTVKAAIEAARNENSTQNLKWPEACHYLQKVARRLADRVEEQDRRIAELEKELAEAWGIET